MRITDPNKRGINTPMAVAVVAVVVAVITSSSEYLNICTRNIIIKIDNK